MQVLVPLPFQDWWVAVSWCKHLPVCLSVCPSVNTQFSSALWPSSVMPLWTWAFVYVSGSSGGLCLILFVFLGTANLFPTAAASSSISTRVQLFSMLANAGCFSFSQSSTNKCELVVRVLGCSLLVFQLAMSFFGHLCIFLGEIAAQVFASFENCALYCLLLSWRSLECLLLIGCMTWGSFISLSGLLIHSIDSVFCRNSFAFWWILDYVLSLLFMFSRIRESWMNLTLWNFPPRFLPIILCLTPVFWVSGTLWAIFCTQCEARVWPWFCMGHCCSLSTNC